MISRLFRGDAAPRAQTQNPGFPLRDSSGRRFGHIDRIAVREGRLWIEGWALSRLVGLANGEQAVEHAPSLVREDVTRNLGPEVVGDTRVETPGFALDIPVRNDHTVFWAEIEGTRYVHALPQGALG